MTEETTKPTDELEDTVEDAPTEPAQADEPEEPTPRDIKAKQVEQEMAMQRMVKQQIADYLGIDPRQILKMDVGRDEKGEPVPNLCNATVQLDMMQVPASVPVRIPVVKIARTVVQILDARQNSK